MENLTTETFKEKIFDFTGLLDDENAKWNFKGELPAIIDFWAAWCGPCRTVAPIFEELDKEYNGVDFYKVDTQAEQELVMMFGIKSIPSFLFIPKIGDPIMISGAMSKLKFKEIIDSKLKNK